MTRTPSLGDLLAAHQETALADIRRHGQGLLRYESDRDVLQGVMVRMLDSEDIFEFRGTRPFVAWLHQSILRYIADRANYWSAQRRDAARLVRLTQSDASQPGGRHPTTGRSGPATIAERRELLGLATEVVAALPPRDREFVRWAARGVPLREQAERLDITYDAAQRASHRAMDRFRKTFQLAFERRARDPKKSD